MASRTVAAIAALAMAVLGVAVALPAAASLAAPGDLAFGTITSDANANNVRDMPGASGEDDLPLEGVEMVLQDANGMTVATTTTAADGTWAFAAAAVDEIAHPGPYTVYVDTTPVGVFATHTAISPDNDFTRMGSPYSAVSSSFAMADGPVELNGLVWPTWKFDLAIAGDPDGWNDLSVYTGSAPFDDDDSEDGWDSAADNSRVRTADVVAYNWSLTLSSEEALGDTTSSAVFEQVIDLQAGAVANFNRIPARCSGTDPASSIVAYPSGTVIGGREDPPAGTTSVVLSCNLGAVGEDVSAILLPTSIWVSNSSSNGSTFSTTARVYAVSTAGTATAQPSGSVENGPIEITSQPRFDLEKIQGGVNNSVIRNIDGVPTPGSNIYYTVAISTDRKVGVEALSQPLVFEDNFWAQYTDTDGVNGTPGDVVTDLEFYMIDCIPSRDADGTNHSKTVNGRIGIREGATADNSVVDSGSCAFAREDENDLSSDYTFTLTGIDMSGTSYPTETRGGVPLDAGPFYVASYRVTVWVPSSEIDRLVGPTDDGVGEVSVSNMLVGFDSDGVGGTSNYGSAKEPGYCVAEADADSADLQAVTAGDATVIQGYVCYDMEDGTRSNDIAGPVTVRISAGNWSKNVASAHNSWYAGYTLLPEQSSWHSGNAALQPGQTATVQVHLNNTGARDWTDVVMYDVFDNTTAQLVPLAETDRLEDDGDIPADLYGYVLNAQLGSDTAAQMAYNSKFTFEFAHVDLAGDIANNGTFDTATDRYDGVWDAQRAFRPDDLPDAAWFADPNDVPGGIDQVNVVRAVLNDGEAIAPGDSARLFFGLKQRDTYYNPAINGNTDGPIDGTMIPSGTVVADFAGVRNGVFSSGGWTPRNYRPQPENGNTDGDRWTVVRAQMALQKRTITVDGIGSGAADFGATGAAIAGDYVIWEVVSTLTAASEDPADVDNVVITDTLPTYTTYNESCTADLTGGTVATTVTENADGTTTLTWDLGTLTPNEDIPSRIICTDTDPLAPNNTALVNHAVITAAGIPPVSAHEDDHTVVLEQTGEVQLKKSVDERLDVQNESQTYTLQVKNYSETLKVIAPTVIDVLPYNGDATNTASVNRDPASDFDGTSGLTGAPQAFDFGGTTPIGGTFYYATTATVSSVADIPQNLNDDTDPGIWTTTVTDWSTVLGFKFVADDNLETSGDETGSGLTIVVTTDQVDNSAGDLYSNRFTAFSDTFMNGDSYQLLTSNLVTVRVVGFSIGDLVWFDEDGDGAFSQTVDSTAPEGVEIDLYDGDDNLVAVTSTDENGRWVVNNLEAGDYYAAIPATEFDEHTDPLYYYVPATPVQTQPNTDLNESVDHHVVSDGVGGVRTSGVMTLDYVDDAEGNPVGQEPAGDNVAGLRLAPLTTDDFSNLTLDLALVRPEVEFDVTKTVDGDASGFAADTFTIQVTCTLDGVTVDGYPVTDTWSDAQTRTFSAPSGAECMVVETDSGSATSITLDPADGTVVLDHNDTTTAAVEVTNTYDEGSIQIAKAFTGPGAEFAAGQSFDFDVQCTFDDRLVYDDTVTLTAGTDDATVYSDVIDGLPVGAECVVTETDEANADDAAAPVTVTVTEDGDNNVASTPVDIANFYSAGSVQVEKTVTVDDAYADFFAGLEYEALVMCQIEDDQHSVLTLHSEYVTLTPGTPVTVQNALGEDALFPVGTHCFIDEESVDQGAGTVTLSHDSYANSVLVTTSDSDEPQVLELGVENAFDMAELTVSKDTIGDVPDGAAFVFQLQCTYPVTDGQGNVVDTVLPLAAADASFTLASGESRTIAVPVGTSCVVTEADDQGALSTTIVDSDDTTADDAETGAADGALDDIAGTENSVEFTNEFPVTISVTKLVTGDAGDEWGTGPFTIVVRCWDPAGERIDMNPSLGGFREVLTITPDLVGIPQELDVQVPVGSTCRAIETVTGQATEVTYDPASNNGSRAVLTAEDGGDNAVTVTNRFDDGALQLLKTLSGAGAEAFGAGDSFEFQVRCEFNGVVDAFSQDVTLTVPDDFDFTDPDAYLESEVFEGLPVGMECEVTETDHGAANEASQPVVVTITDEVTVVDAEFDNRYAAGHIALAKSIDAPTTEATTFFEGLTYSAQVTCQRDLGGVITTVHSAVYTVTPGVPVRPLLAGEPLLLPIGTKCFIGEVVGQGADAVSVNFDSYDNAAEVFAAGTDDVQDLELGLTNTWNEATLKVTKTTEGAAPLGADYDFQVQCTYPVTDEQGGVIDEVFPLTDEDAMFSLKAGETREITVPEGVTCTVTEDTPADVLEVEISDSDDGSAGGGVDGVVTDIAGTAQVAFVNVYKPRVYADTGAQGITPMIAVTAGLLGIGAVLLIGGTRRRGDNVTGRHSASS